MINEAEWELIFSEFRRDDVNPLLLIPLPRDFYRHTIRIEVTATDIPSSWRTAGWLYHRLTDFNSPHRDILSENRVLVNCRQVIQLHKVSPVFYLEYLPAKWYIWQDIKIWYWTLGE
ncbi:hypothetical protein VB834_09230 [Limnoraphis robusta Tam1]|uniref:Uncharacterized protein n=1 Tax=Limnoraphis robusta CCNP1315 TaxID=3110306 RepID=A0ABU5TXC2_9CYAN|nr:hypothetical protein [Limnoraphis robusta]MEA5500367.1 hypothetical protein [Limnoraphis robusta BA-68 BA1]MEA5519551.1 hypothetical protein [Limnoraphis robusta CCNP1315]MEA5539215.1 hypothetical protein [Limnoraphis robusta Tam1]MEA5545819.1 hypothetical protein [Limnoraphis robusta CCNP1324]